MTWLFIVKSETTERQVSRRVYERGSNRGKGRRRGTSHLEYSTKRTTVYWLEGYITFASSNYNQLQMAKPNMMGNPGMQMGMQTG